MEPDELEQVESYRTQVTITFGKIFAAEFTRFPDGQRLLRRFNDAMDRALTGLPFGAVVEIHNELCIGRALLLSTSSPLLSLSYAPALQGCKNRLILAAYLQRG